MGTKKNSSKETRRRAKDLSKSEASKIYNIPLLLCPAHENDWNKMKRYR